MDNNNLIDFTKEMCEGGKQLSSPLIPVPEIIGRRLSDLENNPFDKVFRAIGNKNDPFECNSESISPKNLNINDSENKENAEYLISPIYTPTKSKRHNKIVSSPLFIKSSDDNLDNYLSLTPSHLKLQNSSMDCNISNISLQILSDSILNVTDVNLNTNFNLALNLPLPFDSSDENYSTDNDSFKSSKTNQILNIPSVVVKDENNDPILNKTSSYSSTMNNAFVESSNVEKLSTGSSVSSIKTPNLFHNESLGGSEISTIFPSVSSVNSKDIQSTNPLNLAFLNDTVDFKNIYIIERKCMSARKPNSLINFQSSTSKVRNLNSSFGGFIVNYRKLNHEFCNYDDDSVFLEASQLAEDFRNTPPLEIEDEVIVNCTPPWLEENINLCDSDEDELELRNSQENDYADNGNKILSRASNSDTENRDDTKETPNKNEESAKNESDEINDSDVKNAKDLLQNLTKILNKSRDNGGDVDQKTLGENLLNSLALALNINNSSSNNQAEENKSLHTIQRSKSDSKVNEKLRRSSFQTDKKITLPKLKMQQVASVKLDKNLKPKTEKVISKGPLKALLPFSNVGKPNKDTASKPSNSAIITPPKNYNSQLQIKKTSTPNETNLKSPLAQSTPDLFHKRNSNDSVNTTPIAKRQFGFPISPLARPASTNDIRNTSMKKSMSPKNNSGSTPNINTALNKSGSLENQSSNSSIPKISRRNSATDIKTARSTTNNGYENSQTARPSQLKRSTSFQNKRTSNITSQITKPITDNNNTLKKYGAPGKIKPLKLIPKIAKTTGNK